MKESKATMKKLAVAVVLLVVVMLPAAGFAAGQGVLDFATVQKAAEQGDAEAQKSLRGSRPITKYFFREILSPENSTD
jgi:hypothetical protein